jgi:phosphoadenosine phosphosulfate reductase
MNKTTSPIDIKTQNRRYRGLTPQARLAMLYEEFSPNEIMVTSSFAATSAMLLKLIAAVHPQQPIYFIETGYHFPETLRYQKELAAYFGLEVKAVRADEKDHRETLETELWKSDPDRCCFINKVQPLDLIKGQYNVWISGLMKWQSDHRESLDIFEERNGILKCYPLLDISKEERQAFFSQHQLPQHPLVARGYSSIGCQHCTVPGNDRDGRWNNLPKTECGLHL